MGFRYRKIARRVSDVGLSEYSSLAYEFADYLISTDQMKLHIKGVDILQQNQDVEYDMEYVHRWTDVYRKSILSKFYQLEGWMGDTGCPITMMTLTGYQSGSASRVVKGHSLSIEDTFDLLKVSWDKLSKILRKEIPDLTYIWIVEPHKSGYPHYHVVLFHDVSDSLQDKIRRIWFEKYQAGSYDHGVDFSVRAPEESIKSIRNYLMKYVMKGFLPSESRYSKRDEWTPQELVFNAVVWKNHYRLWDSSRNLKKVMAYQGEERPKNIIWEEMRLTNAYQDVTHPMWVKSPQVVQAIRLGRLRSIIPDFPESDPPGEG